MTDAAREHTRKIVKVGQHDGDVDVDLVYPDFTKPPAKVTVDIEHVRVVSPVRVWYDAIAHAWVFEAQQSRVVEQISEHSAITEDTWKEIARVPGDGLDR